MKIAIKWGGSDIVIYGIPIVTVAMGCFTLTMAELASVYPAAGESYHSGGLSSWYLIVLIVSL